MEWDGNEEERKGLRKRRRDRNEDSDGLFKKQQSEETTKWRNNEVKKQQSKETTKW